MKCFISWLRLWVIGLTRQRDLLMCRAGAGKADPISGALVSALILSYAFRNFDLLHKRL